MLAAFLDRNLIGLNDGPDVRLNVSPDVGVGLDIGSDVGSDVRSDVESDVGLAILREYFGRVAWTD